MHTAQINNLRAQCLFYDVVSPYRFRKLKKNRCHSRMSFVHVIKITMKVLKNELRCRKNNDEAICQVLECRKNNDKEYLM